MIGVYRITNTITDRVYIGSSVDINRRIKEHSYKLSMGRHANVHLQSSWNKHGAAAFIFEPLLECSVETRAEREQRFVDAYVLHDLPIYNQQASAESREGFGFKHSEETKYKIGLAHRGKIVLESTRKKISDAAKGRVVSTKTREKLRIAGCGRKKSLATIEKYRLSRTGVRISELVRNARLGRSMPESVRLALRRANVGRVASKETRERMRNAGSGVPWTNAERQAYENKKRVSRG